MRTLLFCGVLLLWSTVSHADLYQWTDTDGVLHVVDDAGEVPEAYRSKLKVYRTAKPAGPGKSTTAMLAPSRAYAANSQGAFAQQLAVDLGLITYGTEDALSPLNGAGIQPAGGWRVDDPLTPEALYEVIAAARRAAASQRLRLSADGAEAIVRQAAVAFLPPPPVAQTAPPPVYDEEAEEPEIIVEQQPPQIIEVIREPVYVPAPVYVPPPVIFGRPSGRHFGHRSGNRPSPPPPSPPFSGSFPSNPTGGPTHMPFGSSQMPFGSSQMPFGSSRAAGR